MTALFVQICLQMFAWSGILKSTACDKKQLILWHSEGLVWRQVCALKPLKRKLQNKKHALR